MSYLNVFRETLNGVNVTSFAIWISDTVFFFQAFANEAGCNLHIRLEHGQEPHHVAEAMFKGFAKALDLATILEPRLNGGVPSTKGTLSS